MSVASPIETGSLGPAVMGPSAMAGGFKRFATLTWTMATLEFKLRFFGSVLGYFWQLARPLMLFGVLYIVFTQAFPLGDGIPFYPVMLLTGIVIYQFYADATSSAVPAVVDRENIVRKIHFPRLAIPAAIVLTSIFNLALNSIAVAMFFIFAGVPARLSWLELPFLLALVMIYALGAAMLLSALYVRYRDVRPIWDVVLQITFYASPVLWTIERIDVPILRTLILHLNPLAPILVQVRHAMVDPGAPSAAEAMGGAWHLLAPAGIIGGLLVLGFYVFSRAAPHIAEDL